MVEHMQIMFVCNEYPPASHGGIGIMVKTLAIELVKLGCHVSVIGYNGALDTDYQFDDYGVQIYWLAKPRAINENKILREFQLRYYLTKKMLAFEKKLQPQIIESFDWSGPLLARPKRAKFIVRMHGAHSAHAFYEQKKISRLLFFFEKRQLKLADRLIAVSAHMGDTTQRCFTLQRSYTVIYNMVDSTKFYPEENVLKDEHTLLYVGRIHPQKGLEELFLAFNEAYRNHKQLRLNLVGTENLAYQKKLVTLLTDDARTAITFIGKVAHDQLRAWYNRAAVTVFPSRAEAFGLTIVESMACGTAPIVSDCASAGEIITHNYDGWQVDCKNISLFAQTLIEVLAAKDEQTRRGKVARQVVINKFSNNVLMEQNLMFYKRCLDQSNE
jgi:L-malate glycosyltransferase